jgi:predicted nucleic acid-binding protein
LPPPGNRLQGARSTRVAPRTGEVDAELHGAAATALLTAGRRRLSLVDCASFEVMRRESIDRALAYDRHFGEQGFTAYR